MKDRLIYISDARLPTEKAHGLQIMKMCEAFELFGLHVTLIHPFRRQSRNSMKCSPFEYYNIKGEFKIKTLPGIDFIGLANIYFPSLIHIFSRLNSFIHSFIVVIFTRRYWENEKIVFYSRDLLSTIALLKLRKKIKCKIIYEAHVMPKRKFAFVIKYLGELDLLVTITKNLKRIFTEYGYNKEKIMVAPDAVDLKEFSINLTMADCRKKLKLPSEKFIIGYIGRFKTMNLDKGISELITAMSYLLKKYNEKKLLLLFVGGPREIIPFYLRQAYRIGIVRSAIQFIGKVPHAEVPYWCKACNLLTIPLPENNFTSYYTSPLKLFEYMASQTPIVAPDLPALREILEDGQNAVLFEAGNSESLADALESVLLKPGRSKYLSNKARSDVQLYTWDNRVISIMKAIKSVNRLCLQKQT